MSLSIVLITYNEEKNIQACLDSVCFADEIVLVDSGSTDATLQLAESYKPRLFTRKFVDFSTQKNFALSQARGDWIFLIDADERVSPGLRAEILQKSTAGQTLLAYEVKRRSFFLKKPLSFSGTQNDAPIRLFPKGQVVYEQPVHEKIVTKLPVKRLQNELIHETTPDMETYRRKMRQYIRLEMKTMTLLKRKVSWFDAQVKPPLKFIKLYVLQSGWRDGFVGFRFALLSAYYDYLKLKSYRRL